MSNQYLRKFSLIVANATQALELSDMHCKFHVWQSDLETPNWAVARVYNLSDQTSNNINPKVFDRVVISAGYKDGNYGTIFDGKLQFTRRGRENQTDKYLEIQAQDGDEAFNFSTMNQTLAAGRTQKDVVDAITKAMGPQGVTQGALPESLNLGDPTLIRGKVMYGLARDYARVAANTKNARWSIQNGKYVMIPNTAFLDAPPIILTSLTGMIGLPEQTQEGIKVKALLNPKLVIGQPVKIDNASIQREQFSPAYAAINYFPTISTDGLYRVIVSEYEGDTRGEPWYSDMTCLSIDPTADPGSAVKAW